MIEFRGELSSKCKKYLLKVAKKMNLILATCIISPFIIANVVIASIFDWIYLAFLPVFLIGIVIFWQAKIPPKTYGSIFPAAIIVETDKIYCEMEGFTFDRSYANIKKVIDYGSFYHILFSFPKKYINFVCEKDLISKGTIDDFENLFASKIIRKI